MRTMFLMLTAYTAGGWFAIWQQFTDPYAPLIAYALILVFWGVCWAIPVVVNFLIHFHSQYSATYITAFLLGIIILLAKIACTIDPTTKMSINKDKTEGESIVTHS